MLDDVCDVDPNDLAKHYFDSTIPEVDLSVYDNWESVAHELNLEKFTPSEVWSRLSSAENTAPGLDRLTYDHWRSIDPEAYTLALIFSLCAKFERIPEEWRSSRTVFIPKKEDCSSIKDWHPISLVSTISKLFTGCLAKRIIDWIASNEILCPAQKGFLPFDGAFENNYIFLKKFQSTRRSAHRQL